MFGFVTANAGELTPAQKERYGAVYCGICRRMGRQSGQISRVVLRYDMAFLALLLLSLYEPDERSGQNACPPHPFQRRAWVDCDILGYCADMNVALAYFNFLDDWHDEGKRSARAMAGLLHIGPIAARWPRQWAAIEACTQEIAQLEAAACDNPDLPAGAFGRLMEELLTYREDFWEPTLRDLGNALGRFIYLMDAVQDYEHDHKRGGYNPLSSIDPQLWEDILVRTMGRCTKAYEQLPLVQDKELLDNILYSGVWTAYRKEEDHGRSV